MILDVEFVTKSPIIDVEFGNSDSTIDAQFGQIHQVSEEYNTYMLVTPDGTEIPAVFVEAETIFDADENDIRKGKTAATDEGVTVGTKEIPAYHTVEGMRVFPAGRELIITTPNYNYTKLQSIVCEFNKTLNDSVGAEKIVINNNVYNVQSTIVLAKVTKESNGAIKFNIVNESNKPYVVRFIFYEEIY